MKRFLIKLFFFIFIPLAVGSSLQFYADRGLRESCSFLYTEWNDIIHSRISADVLILGSSRAWVHISPKVMDSSLQVNSYNLGLDGYNFLMQNYRFKLFLKYNKKPRYIIQALETNTLSKRSTLLNYQQFIPYLNEAEIKEAISHYKGIDFKDIYIPGYKYRSDPDTLKLGLRTYFKGSEVCSKKYKGFLSSNDSWDNEFEEFIKKNPNGVREKLDTLTINRFDAFLNFCRENNIHVILVYPPEYAGVHKYILNRDSIMTLYKNFSLNYNIPFFDYSKDTICQSKQYFYNSQHLNTTGVNLFNAHLAKDLEKIIKQE